MSDSITFHIDESAFHGVNLFFSADEKGIKVVITATTKGSNGKIVIEGYYQIQQMRSAFAAMETFARLAQEGGDNE